MNDERAFLKAIWRKPNDVTARLVYADWLQENGHDWEAQAVRYWCGLHKADREILRLWVYRPRCEAASISGLFVFGMLDRLVIEVFPYLTRNGWRPGKTTPPEFFPAMRRLKRYIGG